MAAATRRDDAKQPKSGILDPDHPLYDPDLIKMPESGPHSQTVDLLVLAASRLLGEAVWIFRDLNWYPLDGGNAIAPDVMVVPREAVDRPPTSYRQDQTDGPLPVVVVEIVSDTDTFASLRSKVRRYQRLGPPVYVVIVDGEPAVLRLGPDDRELVSWNGQPIDELGGLVADVVDGRLQVTLPDGTTGREIGDLLAAFDARADEAESRADELRAQLRRLGVEPGG